MARNRPNLVCTARRAILLLLVAACSQAPEIANDPIQGFEVAYSLLAMESEQEILEAPKEHPPRQDLFQPRRSGEEAHYSHLPALILRPTTRVRYELPAVHPSAELRFTLCPALNAYGGSAQATVTATWNGQPCFEESLDCSKQVPAEERRWRHYSIPVPTGGVLEFLVTFEGPHEVPPQIGLGRLQVGVPFDAPRSTSAPARPNVVLVVIDTLRADRLGCYGADKPLSPVMDALAERGTRFARAYSSAPWTLPGTASILTGKTPYEHGVGISNSFYLSDAFDTLAEPFQRHGVTTAAFTCNPLIAGSRNFDQGFEHFRNYRWARAKVIHDDVVEWLDARGDERFFLYLHTVDPHDPYEPTEATAKRLVGPAPADFIPRELRPQAGQFYGPDGFDKERLISSNNHQFELYDAEVFDVDEALGRIIDKLRALDLLDKTIIAVTSDHGEEFLEHGWVGHNSQLHDEQTHVPLIIAGPGIPSGEVVETALENRYLFRTILEAAHVPGAPSTEPNLLERDADGQLAPQTEDLPVLLVNGPSKYADFESRTLVNLRSTQALIDGDWRFQLGAPANDETPTIIALYNLASDPQCQTNLADQYPQRLDQMRARAHELITEARDNRPALVPSTQGTLDLLRANGYLGDDSED